MKNINSNSKIYLQDRVPKSTPTLPQSSNQGLNRKVKKAQKNKSGSAVTFPTFTRKNLKLTNNVASLVKKYANYIFNELKLDKNKD